MNPGLGLCTLAGKKSDLYSIHCIGIGDIIFIFHSTLLRDEAGRVKISPSRNNYNIIIADG